MINITTAGLDGLGIIALISGGIVTLFSTASKQTKADQRELINTIQEQRDADREIFNKTTTADRAAFTKTIADERETFNKRITALEIQKQDNIKAISRLEGQIIAYKDIPLQSIADSMTKMASVNVSIAESNAKILDTLNNSALIAATDRDILTSIPSATQNVKEQTVEHQTVKGA